MKNKIKMKNGLKSRKQKIFNHPVTVIIFGILTCLIVPVFIKVAILQPLFGLLDISETISKSIQGIITAAVILFTYRLFVKRFEKREATELSKENLAKELVFGFLGGFLLISFITLFFYLLGYYTAASVNHFSVLIKPLIIFIVMGVWEEVIFRGLIFRITESKLGTVWALIISSLIFGFVHVSNDNFNFLSGLAIALELGLLTGITFSITRRLWVPIALHIGWNISFIFYGTIVSGATEFPSFIVSKLRGANLITGGMFGPENSIITIVFSLIAFGFLYKQKIT